MAGPDDRFCSSLDLHCGPIPAQAGVKSRAAMLNAAFWGCGSRLTVAFLEGDPALHQRVADIAGRWISETKADIAFEFWINASRHPREANLRVAFRPEGGSQSVLGKFALQVDPSQPTMNLGWMTLDLAEDQASAVVLHEFGHALGLIHEHLSPVQCIDWNKPAVVADLHRTQGWDDATIQANMFARYDAAAVFATDVDPTSIMMYPIPARWTNNGFATEFNTSLSPQDVALVRAVYGIRRAGIA